MQMCKTLDVWHHRALLSQTDPVLKSTKRVQECLHQNAPSFNTDSNQQQTRPTHENDWSILYYKSTILKIVSEPPLVSNDCGCLLLWSNTRHSPQIVHKLFTVQWFFKAKIMIVGMIYWVFWDILEALQWFASDFGLLYVISINCCWVENQG